jgi:zinc protease
VTGEETVSKNGIVQWTLANGAKVIVYPTDYKADEIQFLAFSRGGLSLVSDADFPSAAIATGYAEMSGLNGFSMTDLGKKLAGKTVSASPWISDTGEGIAGSSSVADLETLFQLVNLEFTRPSFSDEAFRALRAQLETVAAARLNSPGDQFNNLKSELVYGKDSIRHAPLTKEFISLMAEDRSEAAFRSRFANAGDFTFVFVGSVDLAALKNLAETYLSVLPGTPVREEARALTPSFPSGITSRTLEMGIDPKSRVFFAFGDRPEFGPSEYELFDAMCSLLDIRLREVIREDMSGSYGVRVSGNLEQQPERRAEISIEFGCEPGREDSLSAAVIEQIKWLQSAPVPESYVVKLRENFRRSREEDLKTNGFWLHSIVNALDRGRPLDSITDVDGVIAEITGESMQAMARKYLDTGNYVRAYLLPQEKK